MRYALRFQGETLEEVTAWAKKVDEARFDVLWSQELHTSPFIYPAAVAGVTKRVHLGSGIALAFVRSPMSMAITAFDLDRLTNGRFILGLGTGVKGLVMRWHGGTYGAPAPHLKECIKLVRLIMDNAPQGKPIQFKGDYYDVDVRGFSIEHRIARPRVPIYAAAIGPAMMRAVGEVADGVLGQIMVSIKWVKDVMEPNLKIGLDRAGRKREEFDLAPTITMAISKDVKKAKRDLAKTISFYCTVATYQKLFEHYGFAKEAGAVREQFITRGGHGPWCWDLISDDMVDAFHVSGSPDQARARLKQYEGIADTVTFTPPAYFITPEETSEYQDAILSTFAR